MDRIVIYRSKYGHTEAYAKMIAEELSCKAVSLKELNKKEMLDYDQVVFGTGVYMGKMKKLKMILDVFKEKQIVLFACGGNNNVEKDIEDIKKNNLTKELLDYHKFFYLPGGMDLSKIKGPMKFMFKLIGRILENKKDKTHDEEEFLRGMKNPENLVDKKHITPLVEFVKQLK